MGANKDNFKRNISKLAAAVLVTTQVGMILPTYASVGTFPTILGATTAVVEAGTSFDFSDGIIASDLEDGELTFTVDSSRVNLKVPGVYTARYSTVDLQNNKITVLRTITVVDRIAAEITGVDSVTVEFGSEFDPLLGVRAVDTVDGDITTNIRVVGDVDTMTPGEYTLTYTVADAAGNVATITRVVTVTEQSDTTSPTIEGANNMSIVVGSEFDPLLGVRAVDTVDGDITMNIRVIGDVDTMTPGEYTLTYTVADAAGNVTTITRVVTVTEEQPTTVIKPPVNNSTSGGQQQSLLPKTGDETVFHVLMVAVACITLGMFGIKPTKKVKNNESTVEEQSSV